MSRTAEHSGAVAPGNEERSSGGWPPRPVGEVFPEILDTVLVGGLLLYDRRGMTVEQGRRNVRRLVKEAGLPTLGRVGSALLYRKSDVIDWIERRGSADGPDDPENGQE